MRLRPGAALVDAPVAQEQLGDAVAGPHEVAPQLLTGTAEVTGRLGFGGGTATGVSASAIKRRTSSSASLRSLLTRSPAARGVLPGAITCIAMPASRAAR